MKRLTKTNAIKRLGRKAKSKSGATLVEMIATVAILSIVALLSFQAIFIANEEYRRVTNISESQRSISLLQENMNTYLKTAKDIRLIDNTGYSSIGAAITAYTNTRNTAGGDEALQDADNVSTDQYNDYIMYRSGTFSYTLSKYTRDATGSKFVPVFTVSNIKQINFALKALPSTNNTNTGATGMRYILDYTITSPTLKEVTDKAVNSADINDGDYSIVSGTMLNNIAGSSVGITPGQLTINEDGTSNLDKNFIYFRTTQKVAI